jgi:hypothetical protein
MPKRTFTENDIKRIASKYIKSVTREPAKVPNIQQIITEAFQKAVPGKPVDSNDITTVIQDLTKRTTISDKVIQEAVKRVVDQGAINDLKFMIAHHAKRLGFDVTPDEIDEIIQYGKLNPLKASLPKVRQTVEDYYRTRNKAQKAPSPAPTPIKDEGGTLVKLRGRVSRPRP